MDEVQVVQERDTGKQLLRELLYVRGWKRHKRVGLEEVKDALPVEISHDADMVPEVEAIPEVDTAVDVILVVGGESGQDPQLDA